MNPLEQATVIAQRIVQIANSENLGEVQLLGTALVEILDEAKSNSEDV